MRRIVATASIALLAGLTGSAASAAGPTAPLRHVGRWIVDARGRVVIVHGLNMVYKRPPYYPATTGFGADDAKFLAHHGFDAIRLGVIYKGVEPTPRSGGRPSYDDAYLAKIAQTQRTLARHGVFSLIDFHQDQYNERFQGEGWPDWQVRDDGQPNPHNGFPGNYVTSPALWHAFDHFWANDSVGGAKLRDEYAAAWRHVAARFRGASRVLGYDLLNEPWPGSQWPTCAQAAGCPDFDRGPLAAMMRETTNAIRKVDARHLVWQEPAVLFNFGAPTYLPRIGSRSGLSFHDYCLNSGGPNCAATEARTFDNADAEAARTDRALMLTEFGAVDDRSELHRIVTLADQHMVPWLEWSYCGCRDPTGSIPPALEGLVRDPAKPPRGRNVKRAKLKILERAYPQAVAGTPQSFGYDPSTRVFRLRYSTKGPAGHRLPRSVKTIVFVPLIHYRHGYRVTVRGAKVASRAGIQQLQLKRGRHASEVRLKIAPKG